MVYYIAAFLRYASKYERQMLLEIDDFDARIAKVNQMLSEDLARF